MQFLNGGIHIFVAFIDEHYGDAISDGVFAVAVAVLTHQPTALDQLYFGLASRADEYIQKVLTYHVFILPGGVCISIARRCRAFKEVGWEDVQLSGAFSGSSCYRRVVTPCPSSSPSPPRILDRSTFLF